MAVMELRTVHLPKPLKCKSGEERESCRQISQGLAWWPQHSHPSAVRTSMCTRSASLSNPATDLGNERRVRSSVTIWVGDNKAGKHLGSWFRKSLSQEGLAGIARTHRIWWHMVPAGWLPLIAVTCNGCNSCVLEKHQWVSNFQYTHQSTKECSP